jgi:fructoselysine-6-P-deglycase FrlB-like protein
MNSFETTRDVLLRQPEVLPKKSREYAQFFSAVSPWDKAELVGFVARGSQYHVAVTAKYLIELGLGIPVVILTPSIITKHMSELKYPRSLVVGFESCNDNQDVQEVLSVMGSAGHDTLSLSPDPDWQTEASANYVLDLGVGGEDSALETGAYLSGLLAAFQLASAMGALNLVDGPTDLELPDSAWVNKCLQASDEDAQAISAAATVLAVGRGYGYSASMELAGKLSMSGYLCKPFSSAELTQTGAGFLKPDTTAVVFGDVPQLLSDSLASVLSTPEVSLGPVEEVWHGIYAHALASALKQASE